MTDLPDETIRVRISGELAAALREFVAKGVHGTLDMFVEQSLWGRIQDEEETPEQRAAMDAAIQEAIDDPGPLITSEEVRLRLDDYITRQLAARAA